MALLIKEDSIFYAKEEATEGTTVYPTSTTDGFIQLKQEGVELSSERETKDRNIHTGTLKAATPRLGMRMVSGSFPCEMKADGDEGGSPDYSILMESLLPTVTTVSARSTTKATGNTGSLLQIEDADIADYAVGDFVVVLESGAYHPAFITARATGAGVASITITPAKASGSFSNSVVISKSKTYKPADIGHKSFTAGRYIGSGASGSGIRDVAAGSRTSGLSMENFTTGELPVFKFDFEGLTFAQTAATDTPYTPSYDTALPSVVLNSKIYKDGTAVALNQASFSIEQPLSFQLSTASANGRVTGRASGKRNITGSISPYTDGTSIAYWTAWEAGTTFALFGYTANPDATNGIALGSIVGFYFPACFITKPAFADEEGVVTEQIEFKATGGDTGDSDEVFIGFC